jgi:hypothetical protein
VERKHQHILNVGRALLFQSKLPKHFWSYAILQAVYIINRIPSPLLNNKSPYSLCHNKDPDLTELKVFGCLCYASTIQNHRTKLDTRSRKSVYLGIKQGVKGAVLYDLNSRNIFVSRNVTFHEQILPYQSSDSKFHWKYYTDPDHSQADLSAETVTYIDDDLDHSTTPTSPLNSDSTPNSDSILNSESNSNHISDHVLHSETLTLTLQHLTSLENHPELLIDLHICLTMCAISLQLLINHHPQVSFILSLIIIHVLTCLLIIASLLCPFLLMMNQPVTNRPVNMTVGLKL